MESVNVSENEAWIDQCLGKAQDAHAVPDNIVRQMKTFLQGEMSQQQLSEKRMDDISGALITSMVDNASEKGIARHED